MGDFKRMRRRIRELESEVSALKSGSVVQTAHKECKCKDFIKSLQDEVKKGEMEMGDLMDKLVGVQKELDKVKEERDDLLAENGDVHASLEKVEEDLRNVELERDDLEMEKAELEHNIKELEEKLSKIDELAD